MQNLNPHLERARRNIQLLFSQAITNIEASNYPMKTLQAKCSCHEEAEHKHSYDERGLCDCGDVWEEDDFSGPIIGEER